MEANYLEFTGQQDLPYVGYVNGRAIVFKHVPGVNDFADEITTQVARVSDPIEYRWLLQNDNNLRPYIPTADAVKILDAEELRLAEEAEQREKDRQLAAALVKVDTAQKRLLKLLEAQEDLMRQAGQKKMEADEVQKTLKEAEDYLTSLQPAEPEEKAEKPKPKPKRKAK